MYKFSLCAVKYLVFTTMDLSPYLNVGDWLSTRTVKIRLTDLLTTLDETADIKTQVVQIVPARVEIFAGLNALHIGQ